MNNPIVIIPIELPYTGFATLAEEAKAEGHLFLQRMAEEWANRFSRPGEVMLGAYDGQQLIAVGGLNICPYSDDERIGRLRHLFVLRAFRNKGIAAKLNAQILSSAGECFDLVRLRTSNPVAIALYEKYGFVGSPHPQASHEISI